MSTNAAKYNCFNRDFDEGQRHDIGLAEQGFQIGLSSIARGAPMELLFAFPQPLGCQGCSDNTCLVS